MNCLACDAELEPDFEGTNYQFDNALWIGFFGGYGMFVDNLEATWPNNGMERLDEDGVEDPDWKPTYNEPHTLRGSDHEAVICHDCAHALCAAVPWIEKLLNSHGSHSHKTAYHDAHPDHYGWDYDRETNSGSS